MLGSRSFYCSLLMYFAFAKAISLQAQSTHNYQEDVEACVLKSSLIQPGVNGVNAATGNYDVTYVRLELDTDPSLPQIGGTVTTHYEAVSDLNQVVLELSSNMQVTSITQRGNPLSFNHNNLDELRINLPQTQAAGVLDSISVTYSGNPISSGFGSFAQTLHSGVPIIWTLSEPYGAKAWWPCKQDLNDKIDLVDIILKTPNGNTGVSNGLLLSENTIATGKEFHWRHTYPIPAYLIAIAVTNYSKFSQIVPGTGLPIDNYVYPENLVQHQASAAVTIPIMQFFETNFGPYPFSNEKYGHAEFGWNGGMEHTTISFMGSFNRGLIAHELAHQWFGNKVTCGSWQDIWLNESFATYLSGMVVEHLDGAGNFKNWRTSAKASATSQTGQSVYVPAQDTLSVSRVFSGRMSYNKGAMVLHQLRREIGDIDFITSLQNYLNDPQLAFNYAKTPDLKLALEQQTNTNLDEFFNDFIYGEGYPNHQINWSPSALGAFLTVNQTQSHPSVSFFEMQLPVVIYGPNGQEQEYLLDLTQNGQSFNLVVPFAISQIEIDPYDHTLSKTNQVTLGADDYAFAKAELILHPNPTSSMVSIEGSGHNIEEVIIYDLSGRLMKSHSWNEVNENRQIELPTTNGLYLLTIMTDIGVYHQKVIKE